MTAFNTDYAKQIATSLPITRGSKEAAIEHLEARLTKWTGDTRRDGDVPKEFWETVLSLLKK